METISLLYFIPSIQLNSRLILLEHGPIKIPLSNEIHIFCILNEEENSLKRLISFSLAPFFWSFLTDGL